MSDIFSFRSAGAFRADRRTHEATEGDPPPFVHRPDLGLWAVATRVTSCALPSSRVIAALELALAQFEAGDNSSQDERLENIITSLPGNLDITSEPAAHIRTSLAILMVRAGRFRCFWSGDCRVYLLRDGDLYDLTDLKAWIEGTTGERGHGFPSNDIHSGPFSLEGILVTGVGPAIRLYQFGRRLRSGDRFMLCSPGVVSTLTDREIAGLLRDRPIEEIPKAVIWAAWEREVQGDLASAAVSVS